MPSGGEAARYPAAFWLLWRPIAIGTTRATVDLTVGYLDDKISGLSA
jgi:hypothetical protein